MISEALVCEAGGSIGYGNTSYNDYYWGAAKDKGPNDYNLFGSATYKLTENVALTAVLNYTFIDGTLDPYAEALYEEKELVYGGLNVAYEF